ncbi:retinol dehydrogenase 11-like [Bicyclus anynana]|uniref:Retinol dehydrogenase 11-like n=1 Tax=Bicyclus anynana TaxID=110368 RepID=A0A6J1MRP7_BICAN|nr:retinol dehydrogenase 11-like [Bicyclus anynana]
MLCIYLILLAVILSAVYLKRSYAICRSKRRLDGRTALITGGTTGMGLQIAKDFAERGARVIIACPFEQEGVNAREYIIRKTRNKEIVFKLLDLSSLASVRKFANEITNVEERLDMLVNNAGVFFHKEYITNDELSSTMQINYFGHFLLTLLLLPVLKKTGQASIKSRIVNVTSQAHFIGKIDLEKINDIKHWTSFQIYANSKLCMAIFTRELARRLTESYVVVNNADPGIVATYILKPSNVIFKATTYTSSAAARVFLKTPWQGAQTTIYAALDLNAETVNGEMFYNCKLYEASSEVYNEDLAKIVWDESVKLVKLNPREITV